MQSDEFRRTTHSHDLSPCRGARVGGRREKSLQPALCRMPWRRCTRRGKGSRTGGKSPAERHDGGRVARLGAAGLPRRGDACIRSSTGGVRKCRFLRARFECWSNHQTTCGKPITWDKPAPGDWLTYNGSLTANRYSHLHEINRANVSGLRLKWIFPIPHSGLEVTPLESSGVMYVTGRTRFTRSTL